MNHRCAVCQHLREPSFLKIKEYPDSVLYLNEDQFFKGYCILEYKKHVKEFFDLPEEERKSLMNHVCFTAKALQTVFSPDKMNYELLGNKVPHLHWHIIPRFKTDPAWPEPVWTCPHPPKKYSIEQAQQVIFEIQKWL